MSAESSSSSLGAVPQPPPPPTHANEEPLFVSRSAANEAPADSDIAVVRDYPAWVVWSAAIMCLVTGTMCNLAVKLQSRESAEVCKGCESKSFDQPFWQTFIMFSGEAICFFIWYFDSCVIAKKHGKPHGYLEFPRPGEIEGKQAKWFYWALPAFCDLSGTAIVNAAFTMTYVSTVQMLRNSVLIVTSLFSIVMLQRPLRTHEWLGILIMTAGMVASGIEAILTPDSTSTVDSSKAWLGIVLTLVGTCLNGFQIVVEEKIFCVAYYPPLKGVGVQGMMGMLMNIAAIGISHAAGLYNFKEGWYQMNHNRNVFIGNVWYLVVVIFFNGSGLTTTFAGSGLLRSVIYSCRAPILWIIELCAKWQGFSWGQFAGLVLSALGFIFYAFLIPGVTRRSTPGLYRCMRRGIPCFCTKKLPLSEDEEAEKERV